MSTSGLTPKKSEGLQSVAEQQTWKGASPNKLSSTSRIMIGLARAQHKIPSSIPDDNILVKQIAVLEDGAARLKTPRSSNLDKTLTSINENITQIGNAGTRAAVQMQNQYFQQLGALKAGFQEVAGKQNTFQKDVKDGLKLKDEKLSEISKSFTEGKEPNKESLRQVTTTFQTLSEKSKDLAKEEVRMNSELNALNNETKQSALAITGGEIPGVGPRPED